MSLAVIVDVDVDVVVLVVAVVAVTTTFQRQDLVRKVEEIYCLDGMLDRDACPSTSKLGCMSTEELTFEQPRRFSLDLSKHRNKDLGMETGPEISDGDRYRPTGISGPLAASSGLTQA